MSVSSRLNKLEQQHNTLAPLIIHYTSDERISEEDKKAIERAKSQERLIIYVKSYASD